MQMVRGSHLYDLVRSVTAAHNVLDGSRLTGWSVFLKTLAGLIVPLSAIPNTLVRKTIAENKMKGTADFNAFATDTFTPTRYRGIVYIINMLPGFYNTF